MNLGSSERSASDEDHKPDSSAMRSAEGSVSPKPCAELPVLGVESKRRRIEAFDEFEFLEKEEDVPAAVLEEFASRMEDKKVARDGPGWKLLFPISFNFAV